MSSAGDVELEWWPEGTIPAPASIVWCNFPQTPDLGKPGPKARPGLVFRVRYADKSPDGRFYVLIAYGTSKTKVGKRPFDFTLANSSTLDVLRLPQATRFDLDNVLWLPWAKPFFMPRRPDEPYATPIVSVLPAALQETLKWTMLDRERHGLNAAYHAIAGGDLPPA
jgi:hypothetical protein